MIVTKDQWQDVYKCRIKERLNCDDKLANDVLQANIDDLDYDDNPINVADEELTYWQD